MPVPLPLAPRGRTDPARGTGSMGRTRQAVAAPWRPRVVVHVVFAILVTAAVLGSAWAIARTEPSSIENGEAVWGPYTDALEPVTYRFRVGA